MGSLLSHEYDCAAHGLNDQHRHCAGRWQHVWAALRSELAWLGRAFWELQDELIRPYGTGSCLQPHPSAVEVDRGVHFGGGTEEDKEWPRVLVFDAKKDTSLINLLRPQDRDASGQGQIPESYGIPNPYDNPYNNPYDFFQENVQSAIALLVGAI